MSIASSIASKDQNILITRQSIQVLTEPKQKTVAANSDRNNNLLPSHGPWLLICRFCQIIDACRLEPEYSGIQLRGRFRGNEHPFSYTLEWAYHPRGSPETLAAKSIFLYICINDTPMRNPSIRIRIMITPTMCEYSVAAVPAAYGTHGHFVYTLLYIWLIYSMLLLYRTDQRAVYLYRWDLSCNQQQWRWCAWVIHSVWLRL